ncbi:MAG: hypothetical protein ACTH54_09900 [Vagococcus salmoninarum]|uniref:hypothetical protein n=1 Tax=Vagococcus salmoninarum TaxID=2739 RepID=UPI003F9BEE19
MNIKIIYKTIKPHGFEQVIINEGNEYDKDMYTEITPPQPCWKPYFDFKEGKWVELATEEEMSVKSTDEDLTELEKLRQTVENADKAFLELSDYVFSLEGKLNEG